MAPIKFIKDCDDSNNKLGQFTSDNNLNCVLTSIISSTGGSSTNLWVGSTNKTINISGTNLSSSQVPVISLCQILNPTACMNVSYTSYTCLPDGSGCTLKTTALGPNLAANSPLYFTTNHEAGPVEEILPYGKLKICPTIGSTACASYNFYYIPAPAPTITNVVFNNPTLIGSSSYWVGGTTATFTVTGTYLNVGQTPEFRLCRPNDDGTTYGACTTNPIFPNMVYTNCNADGKSCSFTTTIIGPNLNANASFFGFFNGVVSGLKVCPVAGSTACRIVPFNYKPA
ncbi:MAG: hypothetical protein NT094_00955 [Candidatus Staskawiczbacteria bacterium]|nr:hypothetical protein [Candidatus Staskawiczbacteria bacterium]